MGSFVLAASPVPARVTMPGLGVLRVDPGWLFTLARGSLDARGYASFTQALPNDPELAACRCSGKPS
jgi:hypothetical protein